MQAVPEMFKLIKLEGDLEPGTHIAVQRPLTRLCSSFSEPPYSTVSDYTPTYYHHGVFLGIDLQVIHFTGETINDAKPRLISVSEFHQSALDGWLYRARYNDETSVLAVGVTQARAFELLKDPGKFPKFDLLDNNCESLATWLKTGEAHTAQGKKAKEGLIAVGAGIGVVTGLSIRKNLDAASTDAVAGAVAGLALPSMSSTLLSSGSSKKSGISDKRGSSDR